MKTPTVKQLREQGCRVRVEHERMLVEKLKPAESVQAVSRSFVPDFEISPRGGVTKVKIEFPNGAVYSGKAYCSEADNYNKRVGVQIATQRALIKHRIDEGRRRMSEDEMFRRRKPPQERPEYNS